MNQKLRKILDGRCGNYIFPFLWLHGEDEKTLREYIKVIYEANIRAVCVESRPHPDFCGPKWWEDMDVILDEAQKRKMKVWILDDAHFPTGFANGAVEKEPVEKHRQVLCCKKWDCENVDKIILNEGEISRPAPFEPTEIEQMVNQMNGQNYERHYEDDRFLGIFGINLDDPNGKAEELTDRIKNHQLIFQVPNGRWRIYGLYLTRNAGFHRNYINMLNEDSCRILLDSVYEPHYRHYKKYFGNTIAGFFSDEPELGNGHLYDTYASVGKVGDLPWSQELEQRLRAEWGDSYYADLIYLWEQDGEKSKTASVRYSYMNHLTDLVKKCFSMQIGNWCHEHQVEYIGHLIEDNGQHARTGASLGHYFRGLFGQDMAGIDDIGGQVFPQGEDVNYDHGMFAVRNGEFYHYMLGKLGSSAAAIEKKKNGNSMCEIFGNYGWEEGVQLEKYLADHFMVRGINHFVPHAFSAKEFPDPDCPPHFYAHGHNPQYRHFGALMRYMNRICELITDGKHIAPAALLYHGEGEWTGRYIPDEKVGHVLYDNQIDYDIIPQDVFINREAYGTQIAKEYLSINRQKYRVVFIPYMQFITKELAEAVIDMREAQVPVLFIEGLPEGICNGENRKETYERMIRAVGSFQISLDELVNYIDKKQLRDVEIFPLIPRIRCLHYKHDDCHLFYLINEGTEEYTGKLKLRQSIIHTAKSFYSYDAWTDQIKAMKEVDAGMEFHLEPRKSIVLFADMTEAVSEEIADQEKDKIEEVHWDNAWKRSICESIAYPDFQHEKEVQLPDQLEKEEPEFSGFVCYRNSFKAEKGYKYMLKITNACEGVEAFVNGQSLGIQIVPAYYYEFSDTVVGNNEVRIEVATTLERKMSVVPSPYGLKKEKPACGSGINGKVVLYRRKN